MNTMNLDILLFSHNVFAYYIVRKYAILDAASDFMSELLNYSLNQFLQ